ncbi:Ig-like domain-containing protein [Acetanaerobacterium elongatum]|uniref:Ig-like domain (Group 2) n=1 Tax=Acetanaerobacterium elongatum TaxID=258515 RepID=A0A1G9U5H8_9FIRM|nr:Ig-like domain-containing protein [Acetanaerobacterium elongatum]SDM55247.1 Ig-like domain (group 2) [Acetanaerobacterium elongatum]
MKNSVHTNKLLALVISLAMLLTTISPVYALDPPEAPDGGTGIISVIQGSSESGIGISGDLTGKSVIWAVTQGASDFYSQSAANDKISLELSETPITSTTTITVVVGSAVPVGIYDITAAATDMNNNMPMIVAQIKVVAPAINTFAVIEGIRLTYVLGQKLGNFGVNVSAASGSVVPSGSVIVTYTKPGESAATLGPNEVGSNSYADFATDQITFDKTGEYTFCASFTPADPTKFNASISAVVKTTVSAPAITSASVTEISPDRISFSDKAKFNQANVTVSGTFKDNLLTTTIRANAPLEKFTLADSKMSGLGDQQWIGLLVITDADVNKLYYGESELSMQPLGESDISEAQRLGLPGLKTFVFWTKASDYTKDNNYTISRFIKNRANGTPVELKFTFIPFDAPKIGSVSVAVSGWISENKKSENNQTRVTIKSSNFEANTASIAITSFGPLETFTLTDSKQKDFGDQQWVGLLVTTNVYVKQLYYGDSVSTMQPLGASDITEAMSLGATDTKTFVFWTKAADYEGGKTVTRYISNSKDGELVTLNFTYEFVAYKVTNVKATNADPSVSTADYQFNQKAISIQTSEVVNREASISIAAIKPLKEYFASRTSSRGRWFGILLSTASNKADYTITDLLYDEKQFTTNEIVTARVFGAADDDSRTVLLWLKAEDFKNGAITNTIKVGEFGEELKLHFSFTDFVPGVVGPVSVMKANPDAVAGESQQSYKNNQDAVTISCSSVSENSIDIKIKTNSNKRLLDYNFFDESQGTGKWVGILVTTSVPLTDLYYGKSETSMDVLGASNITKARAFGAKDDNTFILWVKARDLLDGQTHYIKNGEFGTVVALNLLYNSPVLSNVSVAVAPAERMNKAESRHNQSILSVWNTAMSADNGVNTYITANGDLQKFDCGNNQGTKKWIGLLITTDADVTDLYYSTENSTGYMARLGQSDIINAQNAGATGNKTFLLWLNDSYSAVCYIRDGKYGETLKLSFELTNNTISVSYLNKVYVGGKETITVKTHANDFGSKVRFTATAGSNKIGDYIAMPATTTIPLVSVYDTVSLAYTAKKVGDITITAEIVDADGKSLSPAVKEEMKVTIQEADVVTGITLNGGDFTLEKGADKKGNAVIGSSEIRATVATSNDNPDFKAVTWKSSNEKVAKVEKGVVTAVGAGNATITATTVTKDASGKQRSASVKVTVKQYLTGASLSIAAATVGESYILVNGSPKLGAFAPVLKAENAPASSLVISYSSDNEGIAKYDENTRKITAIGHGDATITATVKMVEGKDKHAVKPANPNIATEFGAPINVSVYGSGVTDIKLINADSPTFRNRPLNNSTIALNNNQANTFTIGAAVNKGAFQKVAFSYSGSNSIFVKDNGYNTATVTVLDSASGTGTITATALDGSGAKASVKVSLGETVSGIEIIANGGVKKEIQLAAGKTAKLSAIVTPQNAANKALKWVSSNEKYVTVDQKGVITAKQTTIGASGELGGDEYALIEAYATDGSNRSAKFIVKVFEPAADVTISAVPAAGKNDTVAVQLGDSAIIELTPMVSPKTASPIVTWKSSNEKIAIVNPIDGSPKGKVTVKAAGTVTITAATIDGTNKTDTIKINVTQMAYDIKIAPQAGAEFDGKTVLAKVGTTIKPAVIFNDGDRAKAPKDSSYELVLGDSQKAEKAPTGISLSKDKKSITVETETPDPYFTVWAKGSGIDCKESALTYKVVGKQGELTAVKIVVPESVKAYDNKTFILLSGKSVPLSTKLNEGDSKPSGVTYSWKAYEADEEGNYVIGTSEIQGVVDAAKGVVKSANVSKGGKCIAVVVTATQGKDNKKTGAVLFKVYNPIRNMSISKPDKNTTLAIGASVVATWGPKDLGAFNKVEWTSSNPMVASIKEDGETIFIKAHSAGTTTIKLTALDGSGVVAKTDVKVSKKTNAPVAKLKLNYSKIALKPGESLDVTAELSAKRAGDKIDDNGVVWTLSSVKSKDIAYFLDEDKNPTLQTVMENGKTPCAIKVYAGKDSGTVKLTALARDGSGVKDTLDVVVGNDAKVTSINLSVPMYTPTISSMDDFENGKAILLAGRSLKINVQINPANAANKTLDYSVEGVDGVTIDKNGVLKADAKKVTAAEFVTVTAKATDGFNVVSRIFVYVKPLRALHFNPAQLTAKPGSSYLINTDNFGLTEVKWISSNPAVASLELPITVGNQSNKLFISPNIGNAKSVTIKGYATDGSGNVATLVVLLGTPVNKIILSDTSKNPTVLEHIKEYGTPKILLQGKSMQFTAKVEPAEACNKTVKYLLYSTEYDCELEGVTINEKTGLLTADVPTAKNPDVFSGVVKVVAVSTDGSSIESNPAYVYIAPATTSVSVTPATLTAQPNNFYTLTAKAIGAGKYSGIILWKSSNPAVARLNNTLTMHEDDQVELAIVKDPGNVKSVTITATAMVGTNKPAIITVNIGTKVVTKVTINKPEKTVLYNGQNLKLTAVTTPDKPDTDGVYWRIVKSDDPNITVNASGILTVPKCVKNGLVTVKAEAKDGNGASDELTFEVKQYATGITIQNGGVNVTNSIPIQNVEGSKIQITANVTGPSGFEPDNKNVTWSISKADAKYATVTDGLVELTEAGAKAKPGTTFKVIATTIDGSNKSAAVKFTIVKQPE